MYEPKLEDLINKMINLNFNDRYQAIDCLKHPYFDKYKEETKEFIKKNKSINPIKKINKKTRSNKL